MVLQQYKFHNMELYTDGPSELQNGINYVTE
jgi:hypothetical protein